MPHLTGSRFRPLSRRGYSDSLPHKCPYKEPQRVELCEGGVTPRQKSICCATSEWFSLKRQIYGFFLGMKAAKRAKQGVEMALCPIFYRKNQPSSRPSVKITG